MAPGVKSSGHGGGRGESGAGRGSHTQPPQAAVAVPVERQEAAAECTAACCVLCACLPVAALCCAARAWLLLARGSCGRARGALAPSASSSSFSDEEIGSTSYRPEKRGDCGAVTTRRQRNAAAGTCSPFP